MQVRFQLETRFCDKVGTYTGEIVFTSESGSSTLWSYTTVGESMKLNVVYTYRLEKPETDKAPAPKIELESPVHVIVTANLPRVVG
jgi:hypothetical protein